MTYMFILKCALKLVLKNIRMFMSFVQVTERSLRQKTAWARPSDCTFHRGLNRKSIIPFAYADALNSPSCTYIGGFGGRGKPIYSLSFIVNDLNELS